MMLLKDFKFFNYSFEMYSFHWYSTSVVNKTNSYRKYNLKCCLLRISLSTENYQFKWSCDWVSSLLLKAKVFSQNHMQFWKRRNGSRGTLVRIRFRFSLLDKVLLLVFIVSVPSQCHWSVQNLLRVPSVWALVESSFSPTPFPQSMCSLCMVSSLGHGFYHLRWAEHSLWALRCCCNTNNNGLSIVPAEFLLRWIS